MSTVTRVCFNNEINLMSFDINLIDKGDYYFSLTSRVIDNRKGTNRLFNINFDLSTRVLSVTENGKTYKNSTGNLNNALPSLNEKIYEKYTAFKLDTVKNLEENYETTNNYDEFLKIFFNIIETENNKGMYEKVFSASAIMRSEVSKSLGKSLKRFVEDYPSIELIYRSGLNKFVDINSNFLEKFDSVIYKDLGKAKSIKELFGLTMVDINGEETTNSSGNKSITLQSFDKKYGTKVTSKVLNNFANKNNIITSNEAPNIIDRLNILDEFIERVISIGHNQAFNLISARYLQEMEIDNSTINNNVVNLLNYNFDNDGRFKVSLVNILEETGTSYYYFSADYIYPSKLIDLIHKFGYKVDKLVEYLTDYNNSKSTDIDKLNKLYDYANMSNKIAEIANKKFNISIGKTLKKFRRYPTNLDIAHNITVLEYNAVNSRYSYYRNSDSLEKKEEEFANVIRSYRKRFKLEENNSKMNYAIIYPETIGDIYKEGLELHNCVFSYLDFIIDRKSIILFLRNLNSIDEPYVTIELNPSTLEITQKSGFGDSEPDEMANLFLENWHSNVVMKNKIK